VGSQSQAQGQSSVAPRPSSVATTAAGSSVGVIMEQPKCKSFQLSVRGTPTAFDISPGNEVICIASPGCLSFFNLNGLGSPRHVIHYEQPKQVRSLKYQRTGNLAALRAGIVSIWDTTNSLRPVIGMLQSPGQSILDLQWSYFNHHTLGTCFQSTPGLVLPTSLGGIHLWDTRSPSAPTLKLDLGKSCSNVEWGSHSSNSFLVDTCVDNRKVLIFDSRLVTSSGDKSEPAYTVEPKGGISNFTWSKWGDDNLLVLSTPTGNIEWWSLYNGVDGLNSRRVGAVRSPEGEPVSSLLPTPLGKAVVLNSAKIVEAPVPTAATFSDNQSKSKSSSVTNILTLQGFPQNRMGLDSLFSGPVATSGNRSVDAVAVSDDIGEGPTSSLAVCSQRILGMKFGTPGRMVPPFHGGFELLALTESATLHALKVPVDAVRRCCYSGEGITVANPLNVSATADRNVANASSSAQSTAEAGMSSQQLPLRSKLAVFHQLKEGPRFLAGSGSDRLQPRSSVAAERAKTPGSASHSITADYDSLVTSAQSDDFWATTRSAILALEEALQHSRLEGVSIGRIDQFARQLTIEVARSSLRSRQGTGAASAGGSGLSDPTVVSSGEVDGEGDSTVSLVISFPQEFPGSGLPLFTVQGFQNMVSTTTNMLELLI
jgi:hypothetical protein